jgi:hypothetical protein
MDPTEALYSLVDIGGAILDREQHHANVDLNRALENFPELGNNVLTSSLKIPQQRAQNVKLGTLATVVEYVFLLPGKTAARISGHHHGTPPTHRREALPDAHPPS